MKPILLFVFFSIVFCGYDNDLENDIANNAEAGYVWGTVYDSFEIMTKIKNQSSPVWQAARNTIYDLLDPNVLICLTNFDITVGCLVDREEVMTFLFEGESSERIYLTLTGKEAGNVAYSSFRRNKMMNFTVNTIEKYYFYNTTIPPLFANGPERNLLFKFSNTIKREGNEPWVLVQSIYNLYTDIGIFSPGKRTSGYSMNMQNWDTLNSFRRGIITSARKRSI